VTTVLRAGRDRPVLVRLARDGRARVAAAVLLVIVGAALFAPVLAPYDPAAQLDIVRLNSQPPSWAHPLGTDPFSRDVLSLSMTLGILIGAVAGYAGGAIDAILMRLVDTALSIPRLLVLIAVVALWHDVSIPALTLLLAGTGWFSVSRLTRAETLVVRERDFVVAARMLGASSWRILTRHVLPNVVGPGLVAATLGIANVILLEAGLSYLGIGVRAPAASWGGIIQDGAQRVGDLWWLTLFPGLAILITVFACNALGDALRDALDPEQLQASLGDDTPHQTR